MAVDEFSPTQIRTLRSRYGLTQEQLAERLGVSFATVNRWESGKSAPQRAQREAIARLIDGTSAEASAEEDLFPDQQPVRGRRGNRARAKLLGNKPMEQMLWDAACSIRGEKDAPKFKDYILPLLFLKRLSDVFDDEVDRLAESYGDRATAMQLLEEDHKLVRFYIPAEARWPVVAARESLAWPDPAKTPKNLGEHLTVACRAVVAHNPSLSGALDLVDFAAVHNEERDVSDAALKGVIETFSDPRYRLGLKDVEPDFLGRCYEYLLRKFAEGSGQSAGEFFTPTEVGFLMARILRPRPGEECLDYACGSAGLLVKLQLVCRELDPLSKLPLKLHGQELQRESFAVARMNTIVHDMECEILRGDSMRNPKFRNADGSLRKFDIVVANPMWNQNFGPDVFDEDAFDRFEGQGGATTGKGDWAWLQHTVACLKDDGRAAVVLDTGAVTRGSGAKNEDRERAIRKWFVDNDLIDGVILLPDNLFYNTTAAGVILVLSKRKPAARKDRIMLLNASRRVRKGRPKNFIPEDAIGPLAAAYQTGEPVEGEVAVVTRQQAEGADYNLSPSRWVGPAASGEEVDLQGILDRFDAVVGEEAQVSLNLKTALAKLRTLA